MTNDTLRERSISRRRVLSALAGATGLYALGSLGGVARAQAGGPWAQAPKSNLEKAKIRRPLATDEEFIEHCVKAKKDGVSRYPL